MQYSRGVSLILGVRENLYTFLHILQFRHIILVGKLNEKNRLLEENIRIEKEVQNREMERLYVRIVHYFKSTHRDN